MIKFFGNHTIELYSMNISNQNARTIYMLSQFQYQSNQGLKLREEAELLFPMVL